MQAVSVDALTGVSLRDGLASYLREGLKRSQLEQRPISLLVIDVDYLKLLNDAFGHKIGDKALLTVVEMVREQLADAGQVFRYGGDEFVVVLPGMSLEAASEVARAMLARLQATAFIPAETGDGSSASSSPTPSLTFTPSLTLSLSIGVASLTVPAVGTTENMTENTADTASDSATADPLDAFASQLFEQADQRAYLSKRAGRGRVTASDAPVIAQEANTRLLGREDALEQLRAFVRAPVGNKPTALPVYGQVGVGFSQFLGYAQTFAELLAAVVVYVPASSARSSRHLGALSEAVFSVPWLSWCDLTEPETVLKRCAEQNRRLLLIVDRIDLLDAASLLSLRRLLAASEVGMGDVKIADTGTGDVGISEGEPGSLVRLICSTVHTLAEDIREHVVLEPAITLTPLTEADGVRWLSSRLATHLTSQSNSAQSDKLWQAIFTLTRGLPARIQRVFEVVEAGLIAPQASAEEVLELLGNFLDAKLEAKVRRSHLPLHRKLFFGREQEIKTITRYLQPASLVTIVAAHGMGKSRLASQVAREYAPKVLGGSLWLSLQGLSNYEQCLYALAEKLDVPVGNRQDPQAPVFHALQQMPTLLVCDDASLSPHVLALLEAVRQHAPATRLLATSQEPLSLAGEQRLMLEGLPVPIASLTNSSYQLFMAHARQVAPQGWLEPSGAANPHVADNLTTTTTHSSTNINTNNINMNNTDASNVSTNIEHDLNGDVHTLLPALRRIHEIVAGMPLGLELAAAWCETYDVPTIADKLNHDALLLGQTLLGQTLLGQTTSPLQAMFTTFWNLLAPYEQRTLASLTVFPSHFSEAAAAEVAGASPFFLTSLWHKAFLQQHIGRRQDDGRYAMPLLLKQFASAKLTARPPWQRRARKALTRYYVGWLRALEPTLWDERQRGTLARIHADLDAIDEAWRHLPHLDPASKASTRAMRLDPEGKATILLRNYYEMRGHTRRGAQLFDGLREALAERSGRFVSFHAYAAARLWSRAGDLAKSQAAIDHARALLADPTEGMPDAPQLAWLGVVEGTNDLSAGQLATTAAVLDDAIARFDRQQNRRGWAAALITRAMYDHQQGDFKMARGRFLQAEWYCRREGIRGELTRALYLHGMMCVDMGDWREAGRLFTAGLARARAISLAPVVSLCYVGLARCALRSNGLGKLGFTASTANTTNTPSTLPTPLLREADDYLARALRVIEPSGSMVAFMHTLIELANVAWASERQQQATRHFVRALTIVKDSPFVPSCLQLLAVFGWHHPAWREQLVPVIIHHPAASPLLREQVSAQFTGSPGVASAEASEASAKLQQVCEQLLELATKQPTDTTTQPFIPDLPT